MNRKRQDVATRSKVLSGLSPDAVIRSNIGNCTARTLDGTWLELFFAGKRYYISIGRGGVEKGAFEMFAYLSRPP